MDSNEIKKQESYNEEIENENEEARLSESNNVIQIYNNSKHKKSLKKICGNFFLLILITIFFFFAFLMICLKAVYFIYDRLNYNKNKQNDYINEKTVENRNINTNTEKKKRIFSWHDPDKKIGLAFVYPSLYANGIARFITLTANHLMKTGKYDICLITSNPYSNEYSYNSSIKRFFAYGNFSLIKNISRHENIDFFILQNVISVPEIDFYKSLGKRVIGLFHGAFMSSLAHGTVSGYRTITDFDEFDSYIFIVADDYFFYKKLGFKHAIFMPNLNTFEPSETPTSNLTNNKIIMLGRFNDPIKGVEYAIKSMSLIVKEIPDAELTLITSDSRVQSLIDMIKELNLTNNVFFKYYTEDITSYFLNYSVLMYTSLTEAFPMAMNEGKAHGLSIVAFNVPYSIPYQDGVIVVDEHDCKSLARETIYLLKDYDYRKRIGEYGKQTLDKFPNNETVYLWERLFKSLLSLKIKDYSEFQEEIEEKYYNEEDARFNLQKHFDALLRVHKNLTCHYLDNLTNTDYIKNIKECNTDINKTNA